MDRKTEAAFEKARTNFYAAMNDPKTSERSRKALQSIADNIARRERDGKIFTFAFFLHCCLVLCFAALYSYFYDLTARFAGVWWLVTLFLFPINCGIVFFIAKRTNQNKG